MKERGLRVDKISNDTYRILYMGNFQNHIPSNEFIMNGKDLLNLFNQLKNIIEEKNDE